MIDLGTVRPGSTIRIPFSSFDKDDGSSITMTNYAVGDILIYKDGSTTERASTNGFTATTDFDSKTGKHLAIIDLSDNSTAGFFAAGSEYLVAIDAVTVDTVTTGGWIARFRIGYVGAVLDTTINQLGTSSNQSVFSLTTGPTENNVLAGMWAIIHDAASAQQCAIVVIESYQSATRTVVLASNPAFGIAAGDNISVMGPAPLQPTAQKLVSTGRTLDVSTGGEAGLDWANIGSPTTTVNLSGTSTKALEPTTAGRTLDVTATGEAGIDWANIGSPTTTVNLSGTTVKTATDVETDTQDIQSRLPAALGANGNIKADVRDFNGTAGTFSGGRPEVNTSHISGDSVAADNLENAFDDTAGPVPWTGIIDQGTAQSATSTTLVLRAATPFGSDDANVGATLWAFGSDQGYWQMRVINSYVTSTDTATVDTWDVTPSGTITYKIYGTPPSSITNPAAVNVTQISGDSTAADNAESFFDGTGYAGTNNVIPTVTTLTNLPAITSNWLTAAGLAADAVAEIADGVWDEAISGHLTAGSTGNALNAAGSAGDPWSTVLPGAYGAGTAGRLVGRSLPDIVAGSASGLLIAGSNAATTFATLTVTGALTAGSNAVPWNAAWDAEVQSEVEDGLNNLGYTTTVSGRIDAAISSRLATASYTAPLDAAGTRSAVGLASANLDTQLDALPTAAENAAALLDLSNGIETGITPRQAIRAMAAILAGIISGAGTGTEVFKAIAAASGGTTRVTVSVDSNGNRSALTLNL